MEVFERPVYLLCCSQENVTCEHLGYELKAQRQQQTVLQNLDVVYSFPNFVILQQVGRKVQYHTSFSAFLFLFI